MSASTFYNVWINFCAYISTLIVNLDIISVNS